MTSGDTGDVQATLSELERKLRELEAELQAVGVPAPPPEPAPEPPPPPPPPPMPEYRAPAKEASAGQLVQDARERAGGLHDQLDELLRFRDQLADAATALVEDYSRVLEQIARAAGATPPPLPSEPERATFPVPPPAPPSPEGSLFSGHVVIDVGPFSEIASLAAFEQSVMRVPYAEDVRVSGFEGHRARIELRLTSEVALVFELRRVTDQGFDVRDTEPGLLTLTIHGAPMSVSAAAEAQRATQFPMRPASDDESPPLPPSSGGSTG